MQKVSAIVPFLNEQKTIASVVKILLSHPLINEVICVKDGSTDKAVQKLNPYKNRIILISLPKNQGKGYALVAGIKKAKNKIVAFFDADLVGLSGAHIDQLLTPILTKEARAVMGYKLPTRQNAVAIFMKELSGERAYYKRDLLPHLDEMANVRFGVEVFLNHLFKNKVVKRVPLLKLRHLQKYQKYTPQQAIKETLKEVVEITQQFGRQEGLLPKDYGLLERLEKLTELSEIKKTVSRITNKEARGRFKRLLAYLTTI